MKDQGGEMNDDVDRKKKKRVRGKFEKRKHTDLME